MKANKALLLNDFIIFCGMLILYTITAISNNIFGIHNIAVNLVICLLAVAFSVCTIFYPYYKKMYTYKVSIINLISPLILGIIAFIIYYLPVFKFIDNRGINNSVCLIMFASFGTKCYFIISELLKIKQNEYAQNALNKPTNYFLKGYRYSYKFYKYFALILYSAAIIFSIINAILMLIDFSDILYAFSEAKLSITILGKRIDIE